MLNAPQPRNDEAGFSLIELVIAMVVIAILVAIVVMSFTGSRQGALINEGKVVAREYQTAVEGYRGASGGRVPPSIGDADWRVGKTGPQRMFEGTTRTYLARVPEQVQGGKIVVGASPSSAARVSITYTTPRAGIANSYEIRLFLRDKSLTVPVCTLTELTAQC